MILIITHKADYTADFVINKLNQRGISYRRLNCEDLIFKDYNVTFDGHVRCSLLGESSYKSVWFRRTKLPNIDELPPHDRLYLLNETDSLIKNLFAIIDANWLGIPFYVYRAENKLLQLKTALNLGLRIPDTIVTSAKEELVAFYKKHSGSIIIKPISQTRVSESEDAGFIFTSKVTEDIILKMEEYDLSPCIYQEYIEKTYEIRVTIVGDKIFAASIDSQSDKETSVDWRRKKIGFQKIQLPVNIEEACRAILNALSLNFGAIDLIFTPAGEYVFLEINPNGQWAWIEGETGMPISDAIIELLTA